MTGCNRHEGGTGSYSDTTSERTVRDGVVVDSTRDTKAQIDAQTDAEKARIEANKDAAKAQLDADKKKAEAKAKAAKAEADAATK
ncbi:MAG: hypothetical protein JWM16_2279 [Verrucomicrobiales bacterium]|nr:hypothetical protein [Verrucomicrobiales bacterium]